MPTLLTIRAAFVTGGLGFWVIASSTGCRSSNPNPLCHAIASTVPDDRVEAPPDVEIIIARMARSFARARLYKPREPGLGGLEQTLAPLIVDERLEGFPVTEFSDLAALTPPFENRKQDLAHPSPGRMTVYTTTTTTKTGGLQLDQVAYLWWYLRSNESDDDQRTTVGRGVRVVLGPDGFPVAWEALQEDRGQRVFYVAHSVEQAAAEQFGDPLPGRRFSVERSIEETPDIMVARALDDGPVPMGPYVYVAASPDRDITTLLCRCMPSQMDSVEETDYYDLEPIESLNAKPWPGTEDPKDNKSTPNRMHDDLVRELTNRAADGTLDRLFRWPRM